MGLNHFLFGQLLCLNSLATYQTVLVCTQVVVVFCLSVCSWQLCALLW
jgi:ABC-type Mn2+/Zn2+ transport system permease subunit